MKADHFELDEYDLGIIAELQNDARRGVGEIANALGIHRNTVSAKLKRLMEKRVVTLAVYIDPRTLGYRAPAIIGIKVVPNKIDMVATQMAGLTNIHHVFVCLGRYDVVLAGSLFRDEDELLSFITNEVGKAPGVIAVDTMITVGLNKIIFGLVDTPRLQVPQTNRATEVVPVSGVTPSANAELDEGDYAIIRELQRDARQSAFALAAGLGMNRNTVAAKLRRLLDQGVVKAVVVANPLMTGYQLMVIFGISVLPGQIEVASEGLKRLKNLQTLIVCIGRYNIMAWCQYRDLEEMYEMLTTELAKVPGVREAEAMMILRTKKTSLAYLASPQSPEQTIESVGTR
jgi:DNA-binding Lrp family transcriptional regulator